MSATPITIVEALRTDPARFRFHLFSNDVDPIESSTIGAFGEATFDGYAPKSGDSFAPLPDGLSLDAGLREISVAWQSTDAEPQTLFGWFVTIELTPGVPVLVAYERFAAPEIAQDGKTIQIRVALSAMPRDAEPGLRVLVAFTALAFMGGATTMQLRGHERRVLQKAKKVLQQIASRDAGIATLSARSRRSRVYVVPADNAVLVNAFTAVTNRVNELLAL